MPDFEAKNGALMLENTISLDDNVKTTTD